MSNQSKGDQLFWLILLAGVFGLLAGTTAQTRFFALSSVAAVMLFASFAKRR